MQRAKKRAVDDAARVVVRHGRTEVTEVVDQLTPEFDKHAAAYVGAVSKLPEDLTAESLVTAGPDAVAAYVQAQQEAAYLNKISSWVASTARLTGGDVEVALRILRPANALDRLALDEAFAKPAEQTLRAIDPVLFTAAKRGVEFGINTMPEAAQLRRELTTVSPSSVKSWR